MNEDMSAKVIAVDFDGTLCIDRFPGIGAPKLNVIDALKREVEQGAITILWTCREGQLLMDALTWCEKHGLTFNYVNENCPDRTARFGNDCRKIGADEYWDDRAINLDSLA